MYVIFLKRAFIKLVCGDILFVKLYKEKTCQHLFIAIGLSVFQFGSPKILLGFMGGLKFYWTICRSQT